MNEAVITPDSSQPNRSIRMSLSLLIIHYSMCVVDGWAGWAGGKEVGLVVGCMGVEISLVITVGEGSVCNG